MNKTNGGKIILDLCGGTGAWSRPWGDAGYDVRVITLPEHNVIEYVPPESVYGVLAAPPCQMFSRARTTAKTPRDFIEGMGPVNACIRIAWQSGPVFFALENPVGFLRQFLGPPQLTFKPCDHGDPYTKSTDLWGWFVHPKKNPVEVIKPKGRVNGGTRDWSFAKCGNGKYTRQELRSMTPPGFAKAFYEANRRTTDVQVDQDEQPVLDHRSVREKGPIQV